MLLDWAVREGVQSTTRYRDTPRRSGGNKTLSSTARPKRQTRGSTAKKGAVATPAPRSRIRTTRLASGDSLAAIHHHDWDVRAHHQLHLRSGSYVSSEAASLPEHQQQQQHSFGTLRADYQQLGPTAFQPTGSSEVDQVNGGGNYSPALLQASLSVKSEGDGDEVITPEASFSFHEPNVLLPELQVPAAPETRVTTYRSDMANLYGGDAPGQVDLSQYTLGSVGGVYDDGMFRGCMWNQDPY